MKNVLKLTLASALAVMLPSAAHAAIITLDFEGVGDLNPVGDYYNGGAGGNLGVSFSQDTLASVDADAGGGGNFANEPSSNTIMFFLDANNAILNVAAGFQTGFSFYYTSSTEAIVSVWDGINGTGSQLGSIALSEQGFDNCAGDPNGDFCNWTAVGVAFGGIARSINFGGTANQTGFDNITFGSERPGGAVPEPATWALMLLGFGIVGASMRRRQKATLRYAF